MNEIKKLLEIAVALKAPKANYNEFGKFNYRTLSQINEALKPLLRQHECALVLSDDIVQVGDRFYIKATAKLFCAKSGGLIAEASAMAREALLKKGMDEAQVSGTSSSYARKYAIGGLFLIDDNADLDSMDHSEEPEKKPAKPEKKPEPAKQGEYSDEKFNENFPVWQKSIEAGRVTPDDVIARLTSQFILSPSQIASIKALKKGDAK